MLLGMKNISQEQAYQQMRTMLNEKQWRQYLAVEAKQRGSASLVAREASVSVNTVKRGLAELEEGESYQPGQRVRKKGGGKKRLVETDATLLADLEQELGAQRESDEFRAVDEQSPGLSSGSAYKPKDTRLRSSALAEELARSWGFLCTSIRKASRGRPILIGMPGFTTSTAPAKRLSKKGHPIVSVDCRKRNCLALLRIGDGNGRPKESRPMSMCMTFCPWPMARLSPTGFRSGSQAGFCECGHRP